MFGHLFGLGFLVDVCNWIVDSWKEVTPECIKNGFRRGKLHDYDNHSSSLSNEFDTDSDSSDSSDEELGLNLPEYSHILEAFHMEPDEEFDGFELIFFNFICFIKQFKELTKFSIEIKVLNYYLNKKISYIGRTPCTGISRTL